MHCRNQLECKWIKFVEENLNTLGLSNIWLTQGCNLNLKWFKLCVKQRLVDQAIQYWHSNTYDYSKCLNYRIYKINFGMEEYLINLPNKLKKAFTKFRCRNNMLPIETGSHHNITRAERLCKLCMKQELGDEFHYILVCPFFQDQREIYITKCLFSNPTWLNFSELFNSKGQSLVNLCKFILIIIYWNTLNS